MKSFKRNGWALLGLLLAGACLLVEARRSVAVEAGRSQVDRSVVAESLGFEVVRGSHIELIVDRPVDQAIAELPAVFDQAVLGWCDFFAVDRPRAETWRVRARLMQDRGRFRTAGLLPGEVPEFRHGYALGREIWIDDQPTDYYRRHLLLHEGVHSFMHEFLGSCGPPWWMEGMAELLATHRWENNRLDAPYFPADRGEVPMLGRIKLVREAVRAGRPLSVDAVIGFDRRAHVENAAYAWSWALTAFLHGHPRYSDRFRDLFGHSADPKFNDLVRRRYADDWRELSDEWSLFAANLEHGHDIRRTAIDFSADSKWLDRVERVTVQSDRGWQNSGLRLRSGVRYDIEAQGRFVLDDRPSAWWCEPNGVTIRYCQGRPLGMLLAAVWSPEGPDGRPNPFLEPIPIGVRGPIEPPSSGVLFLAVNDLPNGLGNNRGAVEVTVRAEKTLSGSDPLGSD